MTDEKINQGKQDQDKVDSASDEPNVKNGREAIEIANKTQHVSEKEAEKDADKWRSEG